MPEKHLYEYSVIRLVPRVEREEFLNMGVVLYCASLDFLQVKFDLNEARIKAFAPAGNILQIKEYQQAFEAICLGNIHAGAIAGWPKAERFRWLTATRSTILQTSSVHTGFCVNAAETLKGLYQKLVLHEPC
jgi:Protein of unknown function (DUF3037)